MASLIGRRSRTVLSGTAVVTLGALLLTAAPAAARDAQACVVKNTDTGVSRPTLQKAVWNAKNGQHLTVRGVCYGATVIAKDVTITGISKHGSGNPILDAQGSGSVITVTSGAEVAIRDLIIRNGSTTGWGGGILVNPGSVTLKDVLVRANRAVDGGGIDIEPGSSLVLNGSTQIRGNTASGNGGGIWSNAKVVMNGSTVVHKNEAGAIGGGMAAFGGSLKMKASSSIRENTASSQGGGLSHVNTAFDAALCGTRIRDNQPDDCAAASIAAARAR